MFSLQKFKDKRIIKPSSKITKSQKPVSNNPIKGAFDKFLVALQKVGKSLMFPIAVLPIAALLLRIGALIADPASNQSVGINHAQVFIGNLIKTPGGVVFDNLSIIFAIGIAFGLANDNRGEAALVGAVVWFGMTALLKEGGLASAIYDNVLTTTYHVTTSTVVAGQAEVATNIIHKSQLLYFEKAGAAAPLYQLDAGVIGGIVCGAIVAALYNRFREIKLPQALAFFGGRRFVPMLGVLSIIPIALAFAIVWPWAQFALIKIGTGLSQSPEAVRGVSTGVYAFLNRILQIFGLHHIINTFVWFQLPETGHSITTNQTETVNGDIVAFQKGIIGSGLFTTGFFPLFLGGLPGCALAMIMTSDKAKRKQMMYFYGGAAGVAFLTGIDEPLVFSFYFVSPLLWFLNAVLTGLMYIVVTYTGMSIGFGFSAGLIDYIVSLPLSWNLSMHVGVMANPLWIWLWSAIMFVVYFFLFRLIILKRNIPTPGRELATNTVGGKNYAQDIFDDSLTPEQRKAQKAQLAKDKYAILATKILEIIGIQNILQIDNCATRLRLVIQSNDHKAVNDQAIIQAGAKGVIRLGAQGYQIIIGADVEHVADKLKVLVQQKRSEVKPKPTLKSEVKLKPASKPVANSTPKKELNNPKLKSKGK